MLGAMARIHFESVPEVLPDDDRDEQARRRAIPVRSAVVAAVLVSALALGLAWLQRQGGEATTVATWTEVQTDARRSTRNVAVFFTRADCVPCVRMETETLADPGIRDLLDRGWILHRVDLGRGGGARLASELGVETPPAMVLTAAGGTILLDVEGTPLRTSGFLDTDALRELLTRPRAGEERHRRREDGHGGLLRSRTSA